MGWGDDVWMMGVQNGAYRLKSGERHGSSLADQPRL